MSDKLRAKVELLARQQGNIFQQQPARPPEDVEVERCETCGAFAVLSRIGSYIACNDCLERSIPF